MALILSLESSTGICSVAIHKDGVLLNSIYHQKAKLAASQLAISVQELFHNLRLQPSDLDAVAVAAGPGSYTGLRIASSTAKGICFALGIPLIAINSLLTLAKKVANRVEFDIFCPLFDARRMEVYYLLVSKSMEIIKRTDTMLVGPDSFQEELENNSILFLGDGAMKCRDVIVHKNAHFLFDEHPGAKEVGLLAYEKFLGGEFESLESFEPHYLKEFLTGRKPN